MADLTKNESICAGIVTYADRSHLCIGASERALKSGADVVVIVDNGSSKTSKATLDAYASGRSDVRLLSNPSNLGSARGFSQALQAAISERTSLVWLLDDDNWPEQDTLGTLVEALRRLRTTLGHEKTAVCASRDSDPVHRAISAGLPPTLVTPPRGAFGGFDFLVSPIRKFATHLPVRGSGRQAVALPYAPYGGLLLPGQALESGDLPNESLVLYADDTEWTMRLIEQGWMIYLVLPALIRDADTKWYEPGARVPDDDARLAAKGRQTRAYYGARNRSWLERSRLVGPLHRLRYRFNQSVLLAGFRWRFRHDPPQLRATRDGIRDGERAELGTSTKYTLD